MTSALVPSPSGRGLDEGNPDPEVIFDKLIALNERSHWLKVAHPIAIELR